MINLDKIINKENNFNTYNNCFSNINEIESVLVFGDRNIIISPMYSFVIPTYKRTTLLKNALESIINQKNSQIDIEIIIVDNDDDFNNVEVLNIVIKFNDPRILYYKNKKNLGACGNWNRGIQLSRSNWCIFLHDDDILMDDYLYKMHNFINSHKYDKTIGYISTSRISFRGDGLPDNCNVGKEKLGLIQKFFLLKNKIVGHKCSAIDIYLTGGIAWFGAPTCGAVINKEAFIKIGGFDEHYKPCPDCFAGYKLMKEYSIYKTVPAIAYYRWSDNDTYNINTLIGLADRFEEFLDYLSHESKFINFFKSCYYFDTINWLISKANEVSKTLPINECKNIEKYKCNKLKKFILRIIQRSYRSVIILKIIINSIK